MALVICPECGKEMSDKASMCPNCGFPIKNENLCTTPNYAPKTSKSQKRMLFIAIAVIAVISVVSVVYFSFFSREAKLKTKYNEATNLYSVGQYSDALSLYEDLGNYKNSVDAAIWCKYCLAVDYMDKGEFETSKNYLKEIEYKDSKELLKQCDYRLGIQAMNNNDWETAALYFDNLNYSHSEKMLIDCQFMQDLEESVLRRMEKVSKEDSNSSSLINTELAYLQKYNNASFYNSSLREYAEQYISGLNLQETALTQLHEWDYQENWYTGLVKRYETLKSLYEEYDFLADNKDFIGEYVNQCDYWKKWLAAFNTLEVMFGTAYQNDHNFSQDDNFFYFTFRNTSQYTFTNQMDFWIYDYDGVNLLNTASIISNDIRPGDTVTVKLYVGNYDNWNIKEYGNWYPEIKIS